MTRGRSIFLWVLVSVFALALLPVCAATGEKAPATARGDERASPIKQGLILLVEFPDVPQHRVGGRYAEKRFFQELNEYVREMSYEKISIAGDVTKNWIKMPDSISRYKISSRNLEVDKTRVIRLIQDAVDAADKNVDFSKYDFVALFMRAQLKDYGMIGLCGYPGMLGWTGKETLRTKSGQVVKEGVAIFSYQAHLGTLFHDVAHILGGVKGGKRVMPCLYDHDLQAAPGPMRETFIRAAIHMGFWDPMSCHFYKWEVPPPGVSSWTKLRMNWIDPAKVRVVRPGETKEILLGPLEDGASDTLVIKVPLSASTYYLLENRQPIGFDRNLPGSGVLISYADDQVAECRHGNSPVKLRDANPQIPNLEGAAFDIGKSDSYQDPQNGFKVQLVGKVGNSYKVLVSPHGR